MNIRNNIRIDTYTLKNGEIRFKFQYHIGKNPITGKCKSTTRRGFKTREEAEATLIQLLKEKQIKKRKKKELLNSCFRNYSTKRKLSYKELEKHENKIKPYKLNNGETRYMFRLYLGRDILTEKSHNTTRRGFYTKEEAMNALLNLLNNSEKPTTFQDVYESWLEEYRVTKQSSTIKKTVEIFNNHILPAIGSNPIQAIDQEMCQASISLWESKLKRANLVKSYASKVMDYAIENQLIKINPFKGVKVSKTPEYVRTLSDAKSYQKEDVQKFLAAIAKEKTDDHLIFRLLLMYGIRSGELYGLKWSNLNFENKTLVINQSVTLGENGLYLKDLEPKEIRTLSLDDETFELLWHWKTEQVEKFYILTRNSILKPKFIFLSYNAELKDPNTLQVKLKELLAKHKLKMIRIKDFRFVNSCILFSEGLECKDVQERLGHGEIRTTRKYYEKYVEIAY